MRSPGCDHVSPSRGELGQAYGDVSVKDFETGLYLKLNLY